MLYIICKRILLIPLNDACGRKNYSSLAIKCKNSHCFEFLKQLPNCVIYSGAHKKVGTQMSFHSVVM